MEEWVLVIYVAWVLVTAALFILLPPARAVAIAMVAGWLLLPIADFPEQVRITALGRSIFGSAYPSLFLLTKAGVVSGLTLLGALLLDFRSFRQFRPRWCDLPMAVWCLLPLVAGLRNDHAVDDVLLMTLYQTLVWGGTYLLGRVYFGDLGNIRDLATTVVVSGLCLIPFCVLEIVIGPHIYGWCFGFHPYATDGIVRWMGYRPILLTEHGNQLGMWMASSALLAVWLWGSGAVVRIGRVPMGFAAGALVVITLACQSLAPILFLAVGAGALALVRVRPRVLLWSTAVAGILMAGMIGIRLTGALPSTDLIGRTFGPGAVESLKRYTRSESMGYRLRGEEKLLESIEPRAIVGWGEWNWWKRWGDAPWGGWFLTVGLYGAVGLVVGAGLFVWPMIDFWRLTPSDLWSDPRLAAATAWAVLLPLLVVDIWLNPVFSVPMLLGLGGLPGIAALFQASATPQPPRRYR